MLNTLKDINWNHLYCFYEVGRVGSLKEAAEYLGLASSTISEQLKKLEAVLEFQLFIRSSKGLSLTKEGERLHEHVREVFEAGSKLLDSFSSSEIGGYSVTVGIEETISNDVAAEFASQYWDLYTPFGTVNTASFVEHSLLIEDLLKGAVDWGISLREPKRKSLDYAKIGSFKLVFCCAEDLYNKFKEPNDIVENIPLSISSWDHNLNRVALNHLRNQGVIPKEQITSDHHLFIQKLCERGRCVMLMAENPLAEYPGLKTFHVGPTMQVDLYAIWKKENEKMISIKKLKELIGSKLSQVPDSYEDFNLQIEVGDVSDELLR